MLDTILRGGTIVDGTGSPAYQGDVGIKDGRVVSLGEAHESANHVIEADDRIVAPGFIDIHTHYDAQLFWDPMLSPSSLHGFTTMVAGNCGFTLAPVTSSSAPYVREMLARVEGIPSSALEEGVPWTWSDTSGYLDAAGQRLGVNVAFFVGHSTLRRAVMNEAANEREATEDEIEAMCAVLRLSLEAGAIGLSTSLARSHSDHEGRPVPSRLADRAELLRLAAVCGEFDGTSIEVTPIAGHPWDQEPIDHLVDLTVTAKRPLNWNAMQVSAANLDECLRRLAASDIAAAKGGRIVGLAHAAVRQTERYSFYHGQLLDMFPGWDELMALDLDVRACVLADPSERERLDALARSDLNPLRTSPTGRRAVSRKCSSQSSSSSRACWSATSLPLPASDRSTLSSTSCAQTDCERRSPRFRRLATMPTGLRALESGATLEAYWVARMQELTST